MKRRTSKDFKRGQNLLRPTLLKNVGWAKRFHFAHQNKTCPLPPRRHSELVSESVSSSVLIDPETLLKFLCARRVPTSCRRHCRCRLSDYSGVHFLIFRFRLLCNLALKMSVQLTSSQLRCSLYRKSSAYRTSSVRNFATANPLQNDGLGSVSTLGCILMHGNLLLFSIGCESS